MTLRIPLRIEASFSYLPLSIPISNINIKDIDFNSAADAINNDGSFMTQKHNLWGLYDNDEPNNPIVPYIYKAQE